MMTFSITNLRREYLQIYLPRNDSSQILIQFRTQIYEMKSRMVKVTGLFLVVASNKTLLQMCYSMAETVQSMALRTTQFAENHGIANMKNCGISTALFEYYCKCNYISDFEFNKRTLTFLFLISNCRYKLKVLKKTRQYYLNIIVSAIIFLISNLTNEH